MGSLYNLSVSFFSTNFLQRLRHALNYATWCTCICIFFMCALYPECDSSDYWFSLIMDGIDTSKEEKHCQSYFSRNRFSPVARCSITNSQIDVTMTLSTRKCAADYYTTAYRRSESDVAYGGATWRKAGHYSIGL